MARWMTSQDKTLCMLALEGVNCEGLDPGATSKVRFTVTHTYLYVCGHYDYSANNGYMVVFSSSSVV